MLDKVTDPNRIVTDELVLKRLAEQGIDPNYVEFWHDYAPRSKGEEYSPYAKFYHDLKSGKRFMAVSGLPMVDAYGFKHELLWREKNGIIENGNNIFHCIIDKGTVRLIVLSDQPTGLKKDDEGQYHPQLFIGASEVKPSSPIPLILATDPVNPSYHDNVTLWYYDTVCRRRIRIIEGRFRERWLIDKHPHGSVRIKHNTSGRLKLKLGTAIDARGNSLKVSVVSDEEIIEASEFDEATFPVEIGASQTFYPDAHVETSSVDGYCGEATDNLTWAAILIAAGNYSLDTADWLNIYLRQDAAVNKYDRLYETHIVFYTAGLPDECDIPAAVLSTYGWQKVDNIGCAPTFNVYESGCGTTAIAAGDYTTHGSVPYCDTAITFVNINTGTPGTSNDWSLNALHGIPAISKTGVSKFCLRMADPVVSDNEPGYVGANVTSHHYPWAADKGVGHKPKLVVTYIPVARHGFVLFQDPGIV